MQPSLHCLLLVDDNPSALKLLERLANHSGYKYEVAKDGEEALNKVLASPPDYYSAIISDYMMPKLDGLEFLKAVKKEPTYQHIPFILQTALNDSDSVQLGLSEGAYYYLTKPLDLSVVDKIIRSAINDYEAHKELVKQVSVVTDALLLAEQINFKYKTTAEAKKIAVLVSKMSSEPTRTVVGIYELMVNSVEHGNLGISYQEKTELIDSKSLIDEVNRRLTLTEYKDKTVLVKVSIEDDFIDVVISDMGEGFDFEQYIEFSPERLMDNHGRGIMMANNVGFEKMHYFDEGRSVLCRINRTHIE